MIEWVDVSEDMPQLDTRYNHLSIPVTILFENGTTMNNCYYAYNYSCWYTNDSKRIKDNVVAWRG